MNLRIHGHLASIQALKIILLISHFVVKGLAFCRWQIVHHGLGSTSRGPTNAAATRSVRQALAQFFKSRRSMQKVAKFGYHAAGEDAKDISLVLCEL